MIILKGCSAHVLTHRGGSEVSRQVIDTYSAIRVSEPPRDVVRRIRRGFEQLGREFPSGADQLCTSALPVTTTMVESISCDRADHSAQASGGTAYHHYSHPPT